MKGQLKGRGLSLKKKALLLVEDDRDFSETVTGLLKDMGYQVVTASKTADALVRLQNQKFAGVVLDLKIPGGGGASVLRSMRETGSLNLVTPVLVVSGYIDRDVVASLSKIANGFIVKPFDSTAFSQKLRETIGDPMTDDKTARAA